MLRVIVRSMFDLFCTENTRSIQLAYTHFTLVSVHKGKTKKADIHGTYKVPRLHTKMS